MSKRSIKHGLTFLLIILVAFMLTACNKASADTLGYTQISQAEAREMMAKDDGHVIVDVRREDEYNAGHIPGAIRSLTRKNAVNSMLSRRSRPPFLFSLCNT